MDQGPALILKTLDGFMTGPGVVRLFGGAAFILGYGRDRTTEDADLLLDDRECLALVEGAGFAEAVEATNRVLEPRGLYLAHVFGPEQQVLAPGWRPRCRPLSIDGLSRLRVEVLAPEDLALTKLGRFDAADEDDVRFLLESRQLDPARWRHSIDEAIVPPEYRNLFEEARPRAIALATAFGG
ncbi:MAG: hypothetical protein JNJ54_33010 [Myxococcaceae bacterium]|nr:hypothetical protein [Myxococcaceae bacterium]